MRQLLSLLFWVFTVLYFGLSKSQAAELKITKIPGKCGYVETAQVSYYRGKMYVGGWLKPHYWSSDKIYVRVDLKNAAGKVVATKTGYGLVVGRPQTIVQFGASYVVSFEASQVAKVTAIEVHYIK